MHRTITFFLASFFCLCSLNGARGQDTGLELMLQVQRMQQWLANSPHADGWRRYLRLNQLESQSVKAWRGDPQVLDAILRQFDSGHAGLDHPVFAGVREAIRNHAQQLPAINGDLAAVLAAAEQEFVPITAERLQAESAKLQSELQLCRNRYAGSLAPDAATALATDLRFDELQSVAANLDLTPVAAGGGSKKQTDDLRALRSILLHFNERSVKQNDRFFAVLRRQLERTFLKYSQWLNTDPRAEFVQHLDRLKADLAKISDPQERAAQGEIALELGWLDATGHAPQLVAAIRARHMLPNARFTVTEALAQQAAVRPVNNTRPVSENILGRQIYGTATMQGNVMLDFVDDPDQAHISIQMRGQTQTDAHTHQGPITAYSGSYADVEVRRSILANVGGMTEFAPYGAASLSSEFRGVNSIRLIEKLAYKEYLRDKHGSEAIGARRLETKLVNEFGSETSTALRDGRSRLTQAMYENNSKIGFVPALYVRTTDDALLGYGIKTDTFQLSAPTDPPAAVTVPADMVLQLHESMLDNYLEPLLARQTIKNVEFGKKFEEWFGVKPKGLAQPASDEIWGITFTQSRPVQFIFDGNRLGIAVAGSKFTRDEEFTDRETGERKTRVKESIDEPMLIKIVFQMQRKNGDLVLVRDGRATVEFTRPGTKTVPKNAFRSFLEDVLNKNLREQEEADAAAAAADQATESGFRFQENLIPVDRLKDPTMAKNLDLVIFRSEQGWITAAWKNTPQGLSSGRVQNAHDTPAIFDSVPAPTGK